MIGLTDYSPLVVLALRRCRRDTVTSLQLHSASRVVADESSRHFVNGAIPIAAIARDENRQIFFRCEPDRAGPTAIVTEVIENAAGVGRAIALGPWTRTDVPTSGIGKL